MRQGEGDPDGGEQRAAGAVPRDGVRRRARAVPRPAGAVQDRGPLPRHQLPLHGRLRGPRLPQRGDGHPAGRAQGAPQGPHHHPARQPREPADHAGVRLLRRVPAQVWQRQGLAVLHRPLRLPAAHGAGRERGVLPARRAEPHPGDTGPGPQPGPRAGGAPRGPHVRPAVERPRRPLRLGHLAARRRLHLWPGHQRAVQLHQRAQACRARAPARHGGLQLVPRQERRHHLQRAQLLLPLRQRRSHPVI
mmetsp:Transcript_31853/g.82464  ORF Transcript_31853/g.82464 Transcript_31853/m.82464 type:complete len:248 (-) Transcript_31853:131-874(-)